MKKILLVIGVLLATTSLTYAEDTETTLSKGDSFLAAFGMETSQGTTGTTSTAGSTTVALTGSTAESVALTSIQNTPYGK